MKHVSTKKYGHESGFSCAFRQWKATSHCNQIHGYALAFEFTFETDTLDDRNWVTDFGGLKDLKKGLEYMFDHTLVVAKDDPKLPIFQELSRANLCQLRIVDAVGCEMFSRMAWRLGDVWLHENKLAPRVRLKSVQVWEHPANSAMYKGPAKRKRK